MSPPPPNHPPSPQHFLPLSCQSTSLCVWLIKLAVRPSERPSACLEDVLSDTPPPPLRPSRGRRQRLRAGFFFFPFPGTRLVLAPGAFVRSIFISAPFCRATVSVPSFISDSGAVSSARVCACVCVCVCLPLCVTWVSQGQSSQRGDGGMSPEDECFSLSEVVTATGRCSLIDWPNHSGGMLNTKPAASGSHLNMLLIDSPQSIKKKKKKNRLEAFS